MISGRWYLFLRQAVHQAGTNLVVGFLNLFLECGARDSKNLIEILLAAGRGARVEGRCVERMG